MSGPVIESKVPPHECDLVMKGGVTSGIVYPPAIQVLKDHYVFNSIGGTSAGAVAAAATAAAELGRNRTHPGEQGDGFDRLKATLNEFTGDGSLFERFAAPKETRPVIELLKAIGALGGPNKNNHEVLKVAFGLLSLFRWNWFATGLGLILGGLIGMVVGLTVPGFFGTLFGWGATPAGDWRDLVTPIIIAVVASVIIWLVVYRVTRDSGEALKYAAWAIGAVFGVILLSALITWLVGFAFPGINGWRVGVAVVMTLLVGLLAAGIGGLLDVTFSSFVHGSSVNFLGIVNGHKPNYDPANPSQLTDFMYEKLNIIAGMRRDIKGWHPLTFGDLRTRKLDVNGVTQHRSIRLEMITTNLSQGIPYRLPFRSDQESFRFIFNAAEFRALFPDEVVDFMIANEHNDKTPADSEKKKKEASFRLPDGYHYMPDNDALPVVVGMRMSLAIPVFFSVIPLYTVSDSAFLRNEGTPKPWNVAPYNEDNAEQDLNRHLFSDGGTTSNFPIQLFDRLIPTRPTFGITIASMPKGAVFDEEQELFSGSLGSNSPYQALDEEDEIVPVEQGATKKKGAVKRVELGLPNVRRVLDYRNITSPLSLFSSVIDTARENRETMLAIRPGYRERIVRIRLTEDEGGMNLAMDKDTIEKMKPLGVEAGAKLLWPGKVTTVERPGASPKDVAGSFNFNFHRWVRFLNAMSQLETELKRFRTAYELQNTEDLPDYPKVLDYPDMLDKKKLEGFPYLEGHEDDWREKARDNIDELMSMLETWAAASVPKSAARATATAAEETVEAVEVPPVEAPTETAKAAIPSDFYFFSRDPKRKDRLPKPKLELKMNPDF